MCTFIMETPKKHKVTQYEVELIQATTIEEVCKIVVEQGPYGDPQWCALLALNRLADIQDPAQFDIDCFIFVFQLFKTPSLTIGHWDLLFDKIYTNTNGNKDTVKDIFIKVFEANYFLLYGNDCTVNIKGDRLLHVCIPDPKYTEVLPLLLERGIDINAVNHFSESALMLAMESGNLNAVKFLLENGANPKLQNMRGHNVLHIAATRWLHLFFQSNILSILGEKGIDIDCPESYLKKGYNTPLITAITHQNYDFCLNMIKAGCDVNSRLMSVTEDTSLHLMVVKQNKVDVHYRVINSLLAAGAKIEAGTKHPRRETPLVVALKSGGKRVVQELLRMNAKPDVGYCRMCTRPVHCKSHMRRSNTNSMIEAMTHLTNKYPQMLLAAGYPLSHLLEIICRLDQIHNVYVNSEDGIADVELLNNVLTSICCEGGLHGIETAYLQLSSRDLRYFRLRCSEPYTLMQSCRTAVRKCLGTGPCIFQQIRSLDIPVILQDFVMLNDIYHL